MTYDYEGSTGEVGLPPLDHARKRLAAFVSAWGDGELSEGVMQEDGCNVHLHTRDIAALLVALEAS